MERWVQYAFFSMVFAGFTSVIARLGLAGISADLGLAIRTCSVFVLVPMFARVLLHEAITPAKLTGAAQIIAGLVVIARG